MASLNKLFLIGRLTRDPELGFTQSGVAKCKFSLAVDRPFKNANGERETDFLNCVAWKKTAEVCGSYLSKGSQVHIEGSIQIRNYIQDDVKKYITEVNVNNVTFLDSKSKTGNTSSSGKSGHTQGVDDDVPF